MKTKITLAALIACIGLLTSTTDLYAEESNSSDSPYYEESMQGNEDSMGYNDNMPTDTEATAPEEEDAPYEENHNSESPSEE